ncbi:hypothetical protein AAFF_G00168800 [Aldrovandia affinis]|uniref:Uncharacterized protein n=1 Tax=Aldrovandia affinis TaxID=143900 RepID=A0AAD7RLU0_9TELE|nr:hypothetical protein AAFF_G00168800 [Aldrovandia affinis]
MDLARRVIARGLPPDAAPVERLASERWCRLHPALSQTAVSTVSWETWHEHVSDVLYTATLRSFYQDGHPSEDWTGAIVVSGPKMDPDGTRVRPDGTVVGTPFGMPGETRPSVELLTFRCRNGSGSRITRPAIHRSLFR